MVNLIDDLKHRARRLHSAARARDPDALAQIAREPDLAALSDDERAEKVLRRHCLAALARQLGFSGWPHAKAVLGGEGHGDLGELMHRDACGAFWNVWSADYEEAARIRAEHGGMLLPYRRQFFIVEPPYLASIGLDPADADWERIGRDFVRPRDRAAWARLASAAVRARLSRT